MKINNPQYSLTIQAVILVICFVFSFNSYAQNNRTWATYYGGTTEDIGRSVATDASGNVYVSGITDDVSGIASAGFQNTYGGGFKDAFLVKFDASGNRLWATYYGGAGEDGGLTVATDASGNVYLAGNTTSTSGMASGGFQNTYGGGIYDAFLVKFDASGNRLWATYYGAAGDDYAGAITIDVLGNIYLGGTTSSTSGIATGPHQNIYGGGIYDAFLVKFDASGARMWSTYNGGNDIDDGYSIGTDATGNVYLAGISASTSGIASNGFQNSIGGGYDAFLAKFTPAGIRLWATYYGGTGNDYNGNGVATDASGNVYMAGKTYSANGIASGGFQNVYGGGGDAYVVKFDLLGIRLWATYYGGTADDGAQGIDTDVNGNVFLVGTCASTTGISSGGFQNTAGGYVDAYLVEFDAAGTRFCATYYGETGTDNGYCLAVDGSGNVYLAGQTNNISAIASGGFQNTYGGGTYDAFLVKFTSCVTVGENEQAESLNNLNIFPNPSNGKLVVSIAEPFTVDVKENSFLEIYNTLGKKVFSSGINQNDQKPEVDISNQPAGIYFVQVTTITNGVKNNIQRTKIVKI